MNGQNHGGKGSAQRPGNQAAFEANYDAIFRKDTAPVVEDPKYYCYDCKKCYAKDEIILTELTDSYDIGDQTVWATMYDEQCGVCNSSNIVETTEDADAYDA